MKKIMILMSLMVALSSTAAMAAIEIRLSHSGPTPIAGATNDEGARAFKEYVERESQGEILVTIFPNNQLGNEREQIEGVQWGTIHVCSISTGVLSAFDPQMLALDIPYLFSSKAVAHKFLDGPMGDRLRQDFSERTNTVMLAFGENGFRHFTNSRRPIKTPADMQGLVMRTQENPAHIAMMNSMGAIPVPIPFGELYTALSQGVADGQENPLTLIEASRLHEVQRYITISMHFYSPFVLIMNADLYNRLTPEQQKIVHGGARAWSARQREFNAADELRSIRYIQEHGVEIHELDAEQFDAFRRITREGAMPLIEAETSEEFIAEVLAAVLAAENKE